MKLTKFLLTPPVAAISVALCAALSSFGDTARPAKFVEYIEAKGTNTGGQWTVLDCMPTSTAKIELAAALGEINRTQTIFCSRKAAKESTFSSFWITTNGFRWDYGDATGSAYYNTGIKANTKFTIAASDEGFYINGTRSAISRDHQDIEQAYKIMLFASAPSSNDSEPTANYSNMKLYSFKVTDGGKTMLELWPCIDENGRPGLFDSASEDLRIYYSQSGADFVAASKEVPGPERAPNAVKIASVPVPGIGESTPAYGFHPLTAGVPFSASVSPDQAPIAEGAYWQRDGYRIVTVSSDGTSVTNLGTEASCSFVPAENDAVSLDWVWHRMIRAGLSSAGNGLVSVNGGEASVAVTNWVTAGAVTLTAVAGAGCIFDRWTGPGAEGLTDAQRKAGILSLADLEGELLLTAEFKPLVTLGDYVQDGLLADWDGFASGGGTSVWADTIDAHRTFATVVRSARSVDFNGSTYASGSAATGTALSKARTVEVVARYKGTGQTALYSGPSYGVVSGVDSSRFFAGNVAGSQKTSTAVNYTATNTYAAAYLDNRVATNLFVNGVAQAMAEGVWNFTAENVWLGCSQRGGGYYNKMNGNVFAIRLYDRELTAEELTANAAVDAARFNGGRNNLFVKGDPAPCGAALPAYDGYSLADNAMTFALPDAEADGWWYSADRRNRGKFDYATVKVGAADEERIEERTFTREVTADTTVCWHFKENQVAVDVDGVRTWVDRGAFTRIALALPAPIGKAFNRWTGADTELLHAEDIVSTDFRYFAAQPLSITSLFGTCIDVKLGDNVAAALTMAAETPDSVVRLAAGTHEETTAITVSNGMRLTSAEGAAATTLKAKLASAVNFLTLDGSGSSVTDITIANAKSKAVQIPTGTTVARCVIRDVALQLNNAYAAVLVTGGTLVDCLLTNVTYGSSNKNFDGGAVKMTAGLVDRCHIVKCSHGQGSGSFGAGISLSGGTLRNSLIERNWGSGSGVGVYMTAGTVENCTIVKNGSASVTKAESAGLYQKGGTVVNSIIWGNFNNYGENNVGRTAGTITYTCTTPKIEAEGNISSDPTFNDPENNDFRIGFSDAVDASTPLAWHLSDYDFAGTNRIVGAAADLGCYEYIPSGLACSFGVDVTKGIEPVRVTVTAAVGGDTEGLGYAWYFTGGDEPDAVGSDIGTMSWDYAAGSHDIRLVVTNAACDRAEYVIEKAVRVSPPVIFVDAKNVSGAKEPYGTSGTAATNIYDAIAWGLDGCEIRVAEGTYGITNKVPVTAALTITGSADPLRTIFSRTGRVDPIFDITASGAMLTGFTIQGGDGQGILLPTGSTVSNCVIRNFSGMDQGDKSAAVRISGGTLVGCVVSNSICGSSGAGDGGGIKMTSGLVDRCLIAGNSSGSSNPGAIGGGVRMEGGTLRNSLITGNGCSGDGSGVWLQNGTIENCTIAKNGRASNVRAGCAGLYQKGGTVKNSIIWGNFNNYGDNNVYRTGGTITYTCTTPKIEAEGNISSDPAFFNADAGDFRIGFSDAVDASTPLAWHETALDLAGNDRVIGAAADFGCYEYVPKALDCSFKTDVSAGLAPLRVTATASVSGDTEGLGYAWYFTGGDEPDYAGADLAVAEHTYAEGGAYDIRLVVTNAAGDRAEFAVEKAVRVAPPVIFVDAKNTEGAEYPYATPATAATNIHDAIEVAVDGCEIRVAEGTYGITKKIPVTVALTITGSEDPTQTVFLRKPGFSNDPLWDIAATGVRISGFTFAEGYGYVATLSAGNVISNCVVRDTEIPLINGTVFAAIQVAGGTVVDSLVTNAFYRTDNVASDGGGIKMTSGLVDRCRIVDCSHGPKEYARGSGVYMEGGTLRNSLIERNKGRGLGSGVYLSAGTVENCTIVANGNAAVELAGHAGLCQKGGTVKNSIIWGNFNANGGNNVSKTGGTITYTCTVPMQSGEGNIDDDPRFANPDRGNYELRGASPCVDVAHPEDWMTGAKDLKGRARIYGQGPDLGCYETTRIGGLMLLVR